MLCNYQPTGKVLIKLRNFQFQMDLYFLNLKVPVVLNE